MGLFDNLEVLTDIKIPNYIPQSLQKYFKASFERNRISNKRL